MSFNYIVFTINVSTTFSKATEAKPFIINGRGTEGKYCFCQKMFKIQVKGKV